MSIHAQINPEAEAALASQRRNSTVSAIIIALLVCTLIGIILYIIALSSDYKNNEVTIARSAISDSDPPLTEPIMNDQVVSNPAPPAANMARLLSAQTASPISIPTPKVTVSEPSLDYGDDDDYGDHGGSGGPGNGIGNPGINIPTTIQKRCSLKDRLHRLKKEGAPASYEDQVVASLRYLQKTQQKNGSWNAQGKPVAMTGLALLAYLGHCETPVSAEFGETVQYAIIYLVQVANKNGGKLAGDLNDKHWCYEHAIATYALAESYTLCKEFGVSIPGLKDTVLAAGNHIIGSQHSSGGWDYNYDTSGKRGGDTSIACWHLQALKACKLTRLEFNNLEKCAKKGIKYLEGAENGKGTIGYGTNGQNLAGGPTMTPGAALCLQQWGRGNRTLARNAVKWTANNSAFDYRKEANLYMHYYASQAMINAQGKEWAEYSQQVLDNLAQAQNKDGSWNLPGGAKHGMTSKHYATCLSTLMMEVYYRFLPSS